MSRIYARSDELVNLSQYLNSFKIKKHQKDNERIPWEEVALGANDLELYLTDDCINFLTSKPIAICKDPLSRHAKRSIPVDNEQTMVSFPSLIAKKEYQRELVFLLGLMLSLNKPDDDTNPLSYEVKDEYRDVLPLFAEYLFLRENGKDDIYSLKRLEELKTRTKDFPRVIGDYKNRVEKAEDMLRNSSIMPKKWYDDYITYKRENISEIEKLTYDTLIPFSSMDATLQLIDMNLSQDEIKEFIDRMFKNESGSRTDIIRDYGVSSNNYKRLIKEFEKYKR